MREECPNCGGDLQEIGDQGNRIACTECPWMKTPYFEGLPIGSTDDGFKGSEKTEGVPNNIENPVQFDPPEVVVENIPDTEVSALRELLRFDDRTKQAIADDLGVNSYSVSAAAGSYEYFRRNGYFDGPEIPFSGDITKHAPENKHKRPTTSKRKNSKKARAIALAEENPELGYEEIAEKVGYESVSNAISVVKNFDDGYKFERFSPLRQDILRLLKAGRDIDSERLAKKHGVEIGQVNSTIGVANVNWIDEVEVPVEDDRRELETEAEFEVESEAELGLEPGLFEQPIEPEPRVEFGTRRAPARNVRGGQVQITLERDVAVDMLIEGEITEQQRRQILEQMLS